MTDKQLFKIGEVARMYHISLGTLRHYEKEGLLTPEYTDQETGYRYYSARQFEILNTIRYLRMLELPLADIKDYMQNREIPVIEEKLRHQKALIQQKKQELELMERKIDHRLQHIEDAKDSVLDQISLVSLPPLRMVHIRDSLRPRTYLDLEFSIRRLQEEQPDMMVFLGKVGIGIPEEKLEQKSFSQYDLVFLLLDDEDEYHGQVETLPPSLYAMIRFRGSHREAPMYYQKLIDFLEVHQLEISGFSQEITLIDNGMTSDPEKFVTEIRIPVRASDSPFSKPDRKTSDGQ